LHQLGYTNTTLSGDTRFDRVLELRNNHKKNIALEAFCHNQSTIVAGSTWWQDEQLLHQWLNSSSVPFKIVLAPHEIDASHISKITTLFGESAVLLSSVDGSVPANVKVVIVDSIGWLSSLYPLGTMAYIGGGFGAGIHNTLEAATYGVPLAFGPNFLKFQEAIDLVKLGGAYPVAQQSNMPETIVEWLNSEEAAKRTGDICADYVTDNGGATALILAHLNIIQEQA